MRYSLVFLIALTISLSNAQQAQIIDFMYTQLLIESSYGGIQHSQLKISPDTQHLEQYQFPQVCSLKEKLFDGTDSSGTVDSFITPEDYLVSLRGKILNLLKLAEQIKTSRNYLEQISKHLKFEEDSSSIAKYKSQLQSLARKESLLSANKNRIQDLTQLLNKRINQYNSNPKNEQFKAASLNFQIENCKSKISYLRQLKEKSISKSSKQISNNFTDFFNSLGTDLWNESQQIQFIDKYFQNISHIKYLKELAGSLRDNIEVDRLNIQYKKSCQREKNDLKNKGSSHDEIKQTLEHLRLKKKQLGNNTNKYCEGVALKLEMQIKRLLKAVNWTFSCADGLQELQTRLQGQINNLKLVQAQMSKYNGEGFQDYQNDLTRMKNLIQGKFQKLKTFTITQYTHQPAELEKIISETERIKEQAQQKLLKLPKQAKGEQNFGEIKNLAEQIKTQKAKFCHQFHLYQRQKSKIWLQIYEFESIIRYTSQMRSQYIKQGKRLQDLQKQYKEMTEEVIKSIENNSSVQ